MDEGKQTPAKPTPGEEQAGNNGGDKLLTPEQVNSIVSKRLAEETAKMTKTMQATIAEEKQKAEQMAKLSAEEREKQLLAEQKSANAQREQQLAVRENTADIKDFLVEKSIPKEFAEYVVTSDKTVSLERAKTLAEQWQKAVAAEVETRLASGAAPKAANNTTSGGKEIPLTF